MIFPAPNYTAFHLAQSKHNTHPVNVKGAGRDDPIDFAPTEDDKADARFVSNVIELNRVRRNKRDMERQLAANEREIAAFLAGGA